MKSKKILILVLIIIAGLIIWLATIDLAKDSDISSFQECVEAGNPVMESYPRQCSSEDGRIFTEDIGNVLEKADLIEIDNPRPNQLVSSTLTIEGRARGNWYFEANFPVELLDSEGNSLVRHYAQAQDNWMTEEFVPFESTIEFETPKTSTGTLILEKANPSGSEENDDSLRIPVKFSN